MEETRWWTKLLLASAVIAVILLASGPLGYKYGIATLQPSLLSLLVSLLTAVLVFLAGLVMVFVASRNELVRNRNLVLIAMGLSLIPMLVMGPQIQAARSVPPIHDITTDTADPPQFDAIVDLRAETDNSLEYGSEQLPAEELAAMQERAYPEVRSLETELSVAEALERAATVLEDQGLEVVHVDDERGTVEAVATTFWFGFKDDLIVRVRQGDAGAVVDVRSVSRVGQSDIGANAARIRKFLEAFPTSG